jgi:hypothetical protein
VERGGCGELEGEGECADFGGAVVGWLIKFEG